MARQSRMQRSTARTRAGSCWSGKPYGAASSGGCTWDIGASRRGPRSMVIRHYVGEQSYQVEGIGTADDLSDADDVAVLDFGRHKRRRASV